MTDPAPDAFKKSLWKIYNRPDNPSFGNLPWDEPDFSERMLREHLDDSHGAASRTRRERQHQIDWLWDKLALQPDHHLLDVTCGPGLYAVEFAKRGCRVTGIDFSPAAMRYAVELARLEAVADRCCFIERDVRRVPGADFTIDAAILLYGQLAVFEVTEAQKLLNEIAQALSPGGRLCLELLNPDRVDKTDSSWWFTDEAGLWGDRPFLHLGERWWDEQTKISTERYHILHLDSGELTEITLSDQTYDVQTMTAMLNRAGFRRVDPYPAWTGLPLYDAEEWIVYLAEK